MSFSLNTTGGVASRFVSQKDLDEAKATKDKEWTEAYARIGEVPPPRPQEEEYDPRSLFEKLQHNKDVKREQWDEKMKMANQFRGLDSEEVNFLEAHQREKHAEEAARKRADDDVLEAFRQAQNREPSPPPVLVSASSSNASRPAALNGSTAAGSSSKPKPKPKAARSVLPPGVIVKKKAPAPAAPARPKATTAEAAPNPPSAALPASASTKAESSRSAPPAPAAPANKTANPAEVSKKRPLPLGLDLDGSSDSEGNDDDDEKLVPEKKART